jgi:hypothetical protein
MQCANSIFDHLFICFNARSATRATRLDRTRPPSLTEPLCMTRDPLSRYICTACASSLITNIPSRLPQTRLKPVATTPGHPMRSASQNSTGAPQTRQRNSRRPQNQPLSLSPPYSPTSCKTRPTSHPPILQPPHSPANPNPTPPAPPPQPKQFLNTNHHQKTKQHSHNPASHHITPTYPNAIPPSSPNCPAPGV